MSEINRLDLTLLDGYVDNLGTDVVQQMIDLYKQQSAIYLQEIADAITEQSQESWQERCHKMKGAAGSVGVVSTHAILVAIEKSVADWHEKSELLANLRQSNDASIGAFEQWLATK